MIIIIFGVTGAGKSLVGTLLAAQLGWSFYDADLFHSAGNIEKMRRGIPLTDRDRAPWLDRLCRLLRSVSAGHHNTVLACSALKESYRRKLMTCADREVRLVYLKGDFHLIRDRLLRRQGHFMDPGLLASQFAALEEPQYGALVVDVHASPAEIVASIREALQV